MYVKALPNPHPVQRITSTWLLHGKCIEDAPRSWQPPPCGGSPPSVSYRCYSCGEVWLEHNQRDSQGRTTYFCDGLYCYRCAPLLPRLSYWQRTVSLARQGEEYPDLILQLDFLALTGGIPDDHYPSP